MTAQLRTKRSKRFRDEAQTCFGDRKVLALNKSWQPVKVITLESAMKKLSGTYKDGTPKAKIIDCVNDFQSMTWDDWTKLRPAEGEVGMRSVNAVLRVPTVIQYTRFDRPPAKKVHYNRRTIYRRDNNTCQYCGKKPGMDSLSIDHVIPRCQGGGTTWENTVIACVDCNAKKAGRTPEQANMKLLSVPRKPRHTFHVGDIRVKDWETFLGVSYWNVQLENDNQD